MNCFVGVGRLTKDPELKFIAGTGKAVCTFNIAINRSFKNKEGKYEADFFNVVVWGKPGENAANYLSKGSQCSVKGAVQNRSYETQNGDKRYITEIIAERVEFLDSKKTQNSENNQGSLEEIDPDDDIPFR